MSAGTLTITGTNLKRVDTYSSVYRENINPRAKRSVLGGVYKRSIFHSIFMVLKAPTD